MSKGWRGGRGAGDIQQGVLKQLPLCRTCNTVIYTTFYEARDSMEDNALLKIIETVRQRKRVTCVARRRPAVGPWADGPPPTCYCQKNPGWISKNKKKQKENVINMHVFFYLRINIVLVRVYRQKRKKCSKPLQKAGRKWQRQVARIPAKTRKRLWDKKTK